MGGKQARANPVRVGASRAFLRRRVRVKQGGLIQIRSSRLRVGEEAEVVIRVGNGQTDGKYDFADLAGKMKWKGDAVREQRRMRNEW
jgi:hypothetical protein